jgi:hypothetical protein
LSYRHDFGLLPDEQRKTVMFQAREWLHAWQKELPAALAIPAVAPGVRALKWEESVKGRWIGTAPVKLGNLAFWIFQSENGYLRHIAGQGAVTSPTLEAAKAAAQADYEARILAALDTPAPAMGELVEALRAQASWVRAALNCASWTWDEDQREAAEIELAAADAVLAKIGGAA